MRNKFLQTSGFLGILILSITPAKSVQRFTIYEDTLSISSDGIRMPTRLSTLEWRGVKYQPVPNRRAKGWIEWNVAPDGHAGPAPIYGEKLTILTETDYANMHYSICCIPYTQVESGHPTRVSYSTQLLFPNNPECICLYWDPKARGLAAIAKENWSNRFGNNNNEATPLLSQDETRDRAAFAASSAKAIAITRKRAEEGNAASQVMLAGQYAAPDVIKNRWFEKDDIQAVFWYRKAAELGNAEGQFYLGIMYLQGRGVEQDSIQAKFWIQKAADQGDEKAIRFLRERK